LCYQVDKENNLSGADIQWMMEVDGHLVEVEGYDAGVRIIKLEIIHLKKNNFSP
jgi:hypothetical protein